MSDEPKPQLDVSVQRQLDDIAIDIFAIGIVPRGFYAEPGKPLNGPLLMEAMKREAAALDRIKNRNDEQNKRRTILMDQYNRFVEVINADIRRENELHEEAILADFSPKQRRKILRKRRSM